MQYSRIPITLNIIRAPIICRRPIVSISNCCLDNCKKDLSPNLLCNGMSVISVNENPEDVEGYYQKLTEMIEASDSLPYFYINPNKITYKEYGILLIQFFKTLNIPLLVSTQSAVDADYDINYNPHSILQFEIDSKQIKTIDLNLKKQLYEAKSNGLYTVIKIFIYPYYSKVSEIFEFISSVRNSCNHICLVFPEEQYELYQEQFLSKVQMLLEFKNFTISVCKSENTSCFGIPLKQSKKVEGTEMFYIDSECIGICEYCEQVCERK